MKSICPHCRQNSIDVVPDETILAFCSLCDRLKGVHSSFFQFAPPSRHRLINNDRPVNPSSKSNNTSCTEPQSDSQVE